jgi:D-tyrosyl-tRNA(Tyr) deacylase
MNLSVQDIDGRNHCGESVYTPVPSLKRQSTIYIKAAKPDVAIPFYENFVQSWKKIRKENTNWSFGATLEIKYINDGPVTIIIDKK